MQDSSVGLGVQDSSVGLGVQDSSELAFDYDIVERQPAAPLHGASFPQGWLHLRVRE